MTIFPLLCKWGHTYSPSGCFFLPIYLTVCLVDYSTSVQKSIPWFFFFSFVIFPRGDVLVYCNHPLWLNMSLFPVFHCYKQCCDVHPCGSREKGRGNIPEAKLKVCAGLPWRLTGKESTCQCRRHRFDLWSWKIPHAEEQLRLCTTTVEPVL